MCRCAGRGEYGFQMCQLLLPLTFALLTSNYCFNFPHIRSWRTGNLSFFTCKMGHLMMASQAFRGNSFCSPNSAPRLLFSTRNSFLPLFCLLFCYSATSFSPSVPRPQTGTLFACIAFLETLGGVAAVSTFNGIYSATVAWYPGFTFLLSAVLLLIPAISLWYVIISNHFIKG